MSSLRSDLLGMVEDGRGLLGTVCVPFHIRHGRLWGSKSAGKVAGKALFKVASKVAGC